MRRILGIASVFTLLAAPLAAQAIRGRVVDARTGEGVPEAAVTALTREQRGAGQARTDAEGRFSFQLRAPGEMRLRVDRTGYRQTLTELMPVGVKETVEVEVSVSAAPLTIAPLRVTARVEVPRRRSLELSGFYERERRGIGEFVRREELELRPSQNLAQVLSRVPGAAVLNVAAHQYVYFPRNGLPSVPQGQGSGGSLNSRPPRGASGGRCLPTLYLDGVRMTYDAQSDINAIVSPTQIEAVEVFRGPSEVPVQWGGSAARCGVILIWTKHES